MPISFEGAAVKEGALQESHAHAEVAPEDARAAKQREADTGLVVDELLVEDVSIDGMCGVY